MPPALHSTKSPRSFPSVCLFPSLLVASRLGSHHRPLTTGASVVSRRHVLNCFAVRAFRLLLRIHGAPCEPLRPAPRQLDARRNSHDGHIVGNVDEHHTVGHNHDVIADLAIPHNLAARAKINVVANTSAT